MTLTPEQWREMDEARRLHRAHQRRPEAMDGFGAWANLAEVLVRHHDTLIDAARPKCGTCKGTKKVMVKLIDGTGRSAPFLCEDCDGTGWAT